MADTVEPVTEQVAKLVIEPDDEDPEDKLALQQLIVDPKNHSKARYKIVNGANVNEPDERGWSALHLAIRTGDQNMVRLVIGSEEVKNPQINSLNPLGYTPLHQAVQMRNPTIVNLLIMDGGVDIDAPDNMGLTPLQAAVAIGGETIVDLLLNANPKPRTDVLDLRGFSLMYRAVYENRPEVVQSLIDAGVDHTIPNREGETPLQHAELKEYDEIIDQLRKYERTRPKTAPVPNLKEKEKGV